MRNVSFEELMEAVDFMADHQYAYGDEIPEDMHFNNYSISFRNSPQFHQAVVTRDGDRSSILVYYNNNLPMTIDACGSTYTPRAYFIAYITGQIDKYYADKKAREGSNVYGYVNGDPVYSHDEFATKARGFGPIESDDDLIKFAEKETGHWTYAGWCRTFTTFYLDSSDHLRSHTTYDEWKRLNDLQKAAQAAEKAADDARMWRKVKTIYWADNSIEEIWEDKDGIQKTVTVDGPHGDACY